MNSTSFPARAGRLEHLVRHFIQHHTLPAPATLRLDVLAADYDFTNMLGSIFPTARMKTFACYQLQTSSREVATSVEQITEDDLKTVQAILAPLKHYSKLELEQLARTDQLYVHKDNGVKAALHAAPYGHKGLEIVTLATAPSHLRRGYASELLKTFLNANPNTDVTLEVNVENTAVSLYERTGFARQDDLTEVWWYLQLT